ncbi:MAG: hypothetical protein EPO65_11555 [Dehalococcoidia bacterium]|nr:MAG: hypothetical protein EPO65_11555 [Dehalococcoidia bacterium]
MKQPIRFALAAAGAGLAWGYLRHRRDGRAPVFAVVQALEWFVAYGGAAALLERVRDGLEGHEGVEVERVTHTRQTVVDHSG